MHKKQFQLLAFALVTMTVISGTAYIIGFGRGVASIPDVDRVSGLKNKNSDGAVISMSPPPSSLTDFGPFWRTWQILNDSFSPLSTSTTIDNDTKVVGAIQGLVNSYGDPYTVFFPPEEAAKFKESVKGAFEGIGAVIGLVDGGLTAIRPLENSPAIRAGLREGDSILAIDGGSTVGITVEEAVDRIRGPKESEVVLTVVHQGETETAQVSIVRGVIETPTVATAVASKVIDFVRDVVEKVRDNKKEAAIQEGESEAGEKPEQTAKEREENEQLARNFSVLQLALFAETSANAFTRELQEFVDTDIDNLIIDLRNNQGGFLGVAVDIASHFLERDTVVVYERSGSTGDEQIYVSYGYATIPPERELNIVILVNRNTASAAEILAGALQEHDVALIVGEKTFGKGSVQQLIDITDTMSLKVTTARWFTPNNVSISEVGLTPDVEVDENTEGMEESLDPALEKAIEILLEKDLPIKE